MRSHSDAVLRPEEARERGPDLRRGSDYVAVHSRDTIRAVS